MRTLLPFLFGAIATILGEMGLALDLVGTAEADAAAEVGRFEQAFSALGATIDTFLSSLQRPFFS